MRKLGIITLTVLILMGCIAARKTRKEREAEEAARQDSIRQAETLKWLTLAYDEYRVKNYTTALEYYNKVFEFSPDNYKAMVNIAVIYTEQKDVSSSKEWYAKTLEIHPDSTAGYLGLAGVYLTEQKIFQDDAYLDSADVVYEQGLEKFPDVSDFYLGKAEVLLRRGDAQAAEEVFTKGLEVNPENWALVNAYVDFLKDQDRWEDAAEWERKITDAKPNDYIAWEKLGDIYIEIQDYESAEEAFLKAQELKGGEDVDLMIKLAVYVYAADRKYSTAEELLKKAIEMDSTLINPHLFLGVVYYNWGKDVSAEKEFKFVLEKDPEYGEALYFMGAIYTNRSIKATKKTTVAEWKAGCANARTAENYLNKAVNADPRRYSSRANNLKETIAKVRADLKKKLFLQGVTEC